MTDRVQSWLDGPEASDPLIGRFALHRTDPDGVDWLDVQHRARRMAPRSRWVSRRAAMIAAAVAAIGIPALALAAGGFDLFGGDPAPARVQTVLGDLDVGAPKGMAPHVDAKRASKLLEIQTSSGKQAVFWIAPTKGGGYCSYVEVVGAGGGGGCTATTAVDPDRPIQVVMRGAGANDNVVLMFGETADNVAELELKFRDGTVTTIPLTNQFFLYEVPAAHFAPDRRPSTLIARDADGTEIGAQKIFNAFGTYPGSTTCPQGKPCTDG